MQILAGVPRGGASNDSGVIQVRNFHRLLLAIMFGNFRHVCRIHTGYCYSPSTAFQWSSISWPWMNLNRYFMLNSCYPVCVK